MRFARHWSLVIGGCVTGLLGLSTRRDARPCVSTRCPCDDHRLIHHVAKFTIIMLELILNLRLSAFFIRGYQREIIPICTSAHLQICTFFTASPFQSHTGDLLKRYPFPENPVFSGFLPLIPPPCCHHTTTAPPGSPPAPC